MVEDFGNNKINIDDMIAFCTDSASNMEKLAKIISFRSFDLLFNRCICHLIDNFLKSIFKTKEKNSNSLLQQITKWFSVSYLRNSNLNITFQNAKIKST